MSIFRSWKDWKLIATDNGERHYTEIERAGDSYRVTYGYAYSEGKPVYYDTLSELPQHEQRIVKSLAS